MLSPALISGKSVSCSIKAKEVELVVKAGDAAASPTTLLSGAFPHAVKCNESFWSLEKSSSGPVGAVPGSPCVVLHLEKVLKTWWSSVLDGSPPCDKIDTSKVDSTQRVDEYDEVTQAAIRKIMFDQQQQRLGLPTSDEQAGKGNFSMDQIQRNMPPPPGDDWHEKEGDAEP